MLTHILHNSPKLLSFFNRWGLELTQPQRQHLLNMADALLVCEDKKPWRPCNGNLSKQPMPPTWPIFF